MVIRKLNNLLHRLSGSPWLVFIIAAAVRLIYLAQYRSSVFYLAPIMDAADYHDIAVSLSQGKLNSTLAYRAPFYPILLGLTYFIFGVGELMPRLFQIAVGAWSCVLVWRFGERLYNKDIGTAAGIVAAVTGLMVYYDLELLPTSLFVFLCLLFILEMIRVTSDEGSWIRMGIYFALAALTRPVILTFLPVALIWIYIYRKEPLNILKFLASAALPLIVSLLVHIAVGSGPVLISAQGGVNFYIGNHHESDGASADFPGMGTGWGWEDVARWAVAQSGKPMTDARIDRMYWREGLYEIREFPGHWFKLMLRKALLFWNRKEIPNNRDFFYHGQSFPFIGLLMSICFPLLLPFAFIGIILGWKRSEAKLLTIFIIIFYITAIQFFITARFRHPLTPLLIVLAVGGIVQVARMIVLGRGSLGVWVTIAIAFLTGLVLPRLAVYGSNIPDTSYGLFSEGRAYENLGRFDEAEEFYLKAVEANSTAPFINYYIAELARRQGNLRKAVEYYRRELELRPSYARAWNSLGVVYTEMNRETQALACFDEALAVRPEMVEASRNAARIYGMRGLNLASKGDWMRAIDLIGKALAYQPDDPLFKTMHLEARFNLGDEDGVREELKKLLAQHPGFQPAIELRREIGQ